MIYVRFMKPQISFFINFFIKNRSYSTIYTFKNYFTTVISAINFQFQQNKSYPNRSLGCPRIGPGRVYALTRDRPDDIGFPTRRPVADRKNPRVKSDRTGWSAVGSVEYENMLPEVQIGGNYMFF